MGDEHFGTLEDPLYLAAVAYQPHWHTIDYSKSGLRPSDALPTPPPTSTQASVAAQGPSSAAHVDEVQPSGAPSQMLAFEPSPFSPTPREVPPPLPLQQSLKTCVEGEESPTPRSATLVTPVVTLDEAGSGAAAAINDEGTSTAATASIAATAATAATTASGTAAPGAAVSTVAAASAATTNAADSHGSSPLAPLIWSSAETDAMQRLQNREFLMDDKEIGAAFATIVSAKKEH